MTELRFIKVEDIVVNLDELAIAYPANGQLRVVMKNGHVVQFPEEDGKKLLAWFDDYTNRKVDTQKYLG